MKYWFTVVTAGTKDGCIIFYMKKENLWPLQFEKLFSNNALVNKNPMQGFLKLVNLLHKIHHTMLWFHSILPLLVSHSASSALLSTPCSLKFLPTVFIHIPVVQSGSGYNLIWKTRVGRISFRHANLRWTMCIFTHVCERVSFHLLYHSLYPSFHVA